MRTGMRRAVLLVPAVALLALGPLTAAPASAAPCAVGSGRHLAGRTLTAEALARRTVRCADLRGAHLDGLRLEQLDLGGADLTGATLRGTVLTQADLTGADLEGADLTDAILGQATVTGADLRGVHAAGADLTQLDLTGVTLHGAHLRGVHLDQATLRRADLRDADLRDAGLGQADLTGARLQGADLTGPTLTQATGLDTAIGVVSGAFPMDAYAALVTLLLALVVLRPRLRRRPGRAAAAVALGLVAAGTVAEAVAGAGWRPSADDLAVLPLLSVVLPVAMLLAARLGRPRPRPGAAAAAIALTGLVGFFLLLAAGTAAVTDGLFGVIPLEDSCRSPACLGGAARGGPGIAAGVALMLLATVLAGLRAVSPLPPPRGVPVDRPVASQVL